MGSYSNIKFEYCAFSYQLESSDEKMIAFTRNINGQDQIVLIKSKSIENFKENFELALIKVPTESKIKDLFITPKNILNIW